LELAIEFSEGEGAGGDLIELPRMSAVGALDLARESTTRIPALESLQFKPTGAALTGRLLGQIIDSESAPQRL
jgi:hypothetical protein